MAQPDGRRGSFSKPVELKVAAVLEMCQSGLTFKTASRLYQIHETVLCGFFHEYMQMQVVVEYPKHVYIPTNPLEVRHILSMHANMGFPGAITMVDGTKVEWLGCPYADEFSHTGKEG